jgi:hypothetical protein
VIKKSDVLAGLVTTPTEISVASGFTLSPAVVDDNSTNTLPILATWSSSSGTYKLFKISGEPPVVPTLSDVGLPSVGIGNKWFSSTIEYNQAPQLDMTDNTDGLDDGDHRMANCVLKNGKLWAVHNTWSTNTGLFNAAAVFRGVVRWLSINPNTAAINEWGKIEDTGYNQYGNLQCTHQQLFLSEHSGKQQRRRDDRIWTPFTQHLSHGFLYNSQKWRSKF